MSVLSANHLLGYVLLDLAIILGAARLVGSLFTKIGQPRVVGEIIAGVLLGPTLLGPTLWPDALGPILATPVFTPATAATLGFTLFLGVMMAATALPVMVRILQERGLSRSSLECTGVAASALATVGLFVAASIASSVAAGAGAVGVLRALGLAAGYLALMLLVVVVRPLLTKMAARVGEPSDAVGQSLFAAVLVLVVALVGLQNGVITPAMQAGVVLVALITTAMTGPLVDAFLGRLPAAALAPIPQPVVPVVQRSVRRLPP